MTGQQFCDERLQIYRLLFLDSRFGRKESLLPGPGQRRTYRPTDHSRVGTVEGSNAVLRTIARMIDELNSSDWRDARSPGHQFIRKTETSRITCSLLDGQKKGRTRGGYVDKIGQLLFKTSKHRSMDPQQDIWEDEEGPDHHWKKQWTFKPKRSQICLPLARQEQDDFNFHHHYLPSLLYYHSHALHKKHRNCHQLPPTVCSATHNQQNTQNIHTMAQRVAPDRGSAAN